MSVVSGADDVSRNRQALLSDAGRQEKRAGCMARCRRLCKVMEVPASFVYKPAVWR